MAICLLAIVPAQFASPQEPTTSAAARNAALIAATDEVLKETSTLRQLSVVRPVQSSTQSRAEEVAAPLPVSVLRALGGRRAQTMPARALPATGSVGACWVTALRSLPELR